MLLKSLSFQPKCSFDCDAPSFSHVSIVDLIVIIHPIHVRGCQGSTSTFSPACSGSLTRASNAQDQRGVVTFAASAPPSPPPLDLDVRCPLRYNSKRKLPDDGLRISFEASNSMTHPIFAIRLHTQVASTLDEDSRRIIRLLEFV